MKYLLFGAYGNGNLGDAIQAKFLRRSILWLEPSAEVWATSAMPQDYPYPASLKLPAATIRDAAVVNSFDVLLVGGGGLLAHPHVPLADAKWIESLKIPIAIFGVGATAFFAPEASPLIQKAAYVSGRDIESFDELRKYRRDTRFVIDPVLGAREVVPKTSDSPRKGVCWILRGPLSLIHDAVRESVQKADTVVCFEPKVDEPLRGLFPEMQVCNSVEQFTEMVCRYERVISMRYHGIILGLKLGIPSFALSVSKGDALLKMLGLPCFESGNLREMLDARIDLAQTIRFLAWHRAFYERNLADALSISAPNSNA